MNVHKGQQVFLKPEWMDEGDEKCAFIAIKDMEKGRVDVFDANNTMKIKPLHLIHDFMISKVVN